MGTKSTPPGHDPGGPRAAGSGGGTAPHARPEPHRSGGTAGQVLFSRVGLRLPETLTYESWARAGLQIARIADSSAWCLGDWLVCGQKEYRDRYRHAIVEAGLDYQTLRNYAWIARRFDLSRRRELLSFQHHAEVASLPDDEQDRWLDEAELNHWSRNQLRENIRRSRMGADDLRPPRDVVLPRVTAPEMQVRLWRAAAEQDGVDLEKWILGALDNAAQAALGEEFDVGGNTDLADQEG
ncbi:LmbU family transcriptional regulator [Umezawaea sp. Da 62-37]|uniref:LmbU family transcriptional regulator n=1 Tax=Umezawaea sp. Da 62-37 TaxID=3075927 RepID=UPI0028F6D87D|nr:LmbU family transcriptional regulator [Umezawaea sp. Da 62-37]WNV87664.1 LmbU family transcriptional regulator [Umezawaea sp. Da 62-37]